MDFISLVVTETGMEAELLAILEMMLFNDLIYLKTFKTYFLKFCQTLNQ